MRIWPHVLSEDATLDRLLAGASIARFGDGEFKLAHGRPSKSQAASPELQQRLRDILIDAGNCLVGIPNIKSATPKADFWQRYDRPDIRALLRDRPYGSAFITRPDSAPWIARPDYWEKVRQLWRDRDVVLVRGSGKSLTPALLAGAGSVEEIVAPRQHAFAQRAELMRAIMNEVDPLEGTGKTPVVILCVGAAATVLAVDLCACGIQALDLGHIGMFLKRADQPPAEALAEGRRDEG